MRVGQNWWLETGHLDELMQRLIREVPPATVIVMEILQLYLDQVPDVRARSFQQDVPSGEM
jgi:hypothetical protein